MSTELEVQTGGHSLVDQMNYARAVAPANLLPANYRNKPADIMLAVGLGQSMGLSPAESLYRIDVIQGKPTASAELIAANVRKAGHRLRMKVTEDPPSATCTIIRSDDPDEPFVITRDITWARRMGLTEKDNYKRQPSTMLSWRAVSACARLACPEALYGVAYTPDEMGDFPSQQPPQGGGLGQALATQVTAEQVDPQTSGASGPSLAPGVPEHHDSGAVGTPSAQPPDDLPPHPATVPESPLLDMRTSLAKAMFACLAEAGIPDAGQRDYISSVLGREITTRKELTDADAHVIIEATRAALDEPFPGQS